MIQRLNQRIETREPEAREFSPDDLFPEAEEVRDQPTSPHQEELRQLDEISARDAASHRKPAYMEELEEMGEDEGAETWDESRIEGFGELAAHLVGNLKEFLAKFSKYKIRERIRDQFTNTQLPIIELVIFLEIEGKMNSASVETMKHWAAEYKVSLKDMITVYVKYRELKDDLQVGAYHDWQREGIRDNTIDVIKKYGAGNSSPEMLLILHLAAAIGFDAARLGYAAWKDRKAAREEG